MDIPGSRASALLYPPQSFVDAVVPARQEAPTPASFAAPAGASAEHLEHEGEQARYRIRPRGEAALCAIGGTVLVTAGLSGLATSCLALAGAPALAGMSCGPIAGSCVAGGAGITGGTLMLAASSRSRPAPTTRTPPPEQTMERNAQALVVNPDESLTLGRVPSSTLNVSPPAQS